jgi:hypothetical protein
MPATRDLPTVLSAAETAAAAGDFATAAAELREALAIQEARLGPSHPDLADTLNNLGVASERARQLDDAERYYRRALAVALSAFTADHPFVATSRQNLREFCEANGRPVEAPKPPAPTAAPVPPPQPKPRPPQAARPAPAPTPRVAATPPPVPAAPPTQQRRSLAPFVIGAIVIVVVVSIVLLFSGGSGPTATPDNRAAATPPPAAPAPPAASPDPARGGRSASPSPGSPSLVNARLCRSLETSDGEWSCDRATSPVRAGALIFLTRIRSDRNVTVQHRWFRGQEMVRSAQLKVAANPSEGYRTYSRYFVTAGAGEWRVELRTSDGALVHEELFTVS